MTSAVERVLADNNTNLSAKSYTMNGGQKYTAFTDKTMQQIGSSDAAQYNRYSVVFNGTSLTFGFCWQKEWNTDYWEAGSFSFLSAIGESTSTNQYLPTVPNTEIKKSVLDTDEINVSDNTLDIYSEGFSYDIEFTVNQETEKANFYTNGSFLISDTINKNIQITGISIQNESSEDSKSLFDIEERNNVLTVSAKESTLSNPVFYGHTYIITVNCSLKDDVEFSDAEKYTISNAAALSINDTVKEYSSASNTVSTSVNIYTVTIYYLDTNKNSLAVPITKAMLSGSEYDLSAQMAKDIENYNRINVEGTISGTLTKNETINVYYDLRPASVLVNYLDEEGNALAESETINGSITEAYETEQKEFYGYELTAVPDNATGKMSEEIITVNYIYKPKDTAVIIKHVDKDGNELAEAETINGKVFDNYVSNEKQIDGFKLSERPENASGIMAEDTITVTYVYEKLPEPIASAPDEPKAITPEPQISEALETIKSPHTGNDYFGLNISLAIYASGIALAAICLVKNKSIKGVRK